MIISDSQPSGVFNLGIPETVLCSQLLTSLLTHLSLTPLLTTLTLRTQTHTHKLQDSLFRGEKKTTEEKKKKKQYLTDSRARVRFRFNVRLHVDGGLWERVAGEELGLVRKGVGLAGVPRGSRPFCTYRPADVTHRYLQAG